MTRKQAIMAIKAAGADGDQKTFLRLYGENRISLPAAQAAYREGQRFAEFIAKRDTKAAV